MGEYTVTLSICGIEAENEGDAKRRFFGMVVEDKGSLDVTVEEVN